MLTLRKCFERSTGLNYTYIIIGFLTLACIFSGYYCIKFALILLRVQDALEEAIDVMDSRYQKMSEILKRPLFFDSPEVRSVLDQIRGTQDSLHQIAYSLSENFQPTQSEQESDKE